MGKNKNKKPFTRKEKPNDEQQVENTEASSWDTKFIGILILIIFLIISTLGVGTYYVYQNFINKEKPQEETNSDETIDPNDTSDSTKETVDENISSDENKSNNDKNADQGESISNSDETEQNGEISESAAKTSIESNPGYAKSQATQLAINSTGLWSATDYVAGDIIQREYQVLLGDTLWEIAEGFYGSGMEWVQILENNKSKIGFLPNGEQSLIFPGTILLLKK